MQSPPPTNAMTMPTPPLLSRSKLPSSPSSARLRRLAPSPVKVPPTPPLTFSPSRIFASHTILGAAIRSAPSLAPISPTPEHGSEDHFEYDFAPLQLAMQSEVLLESCREVLEQCRDVAARRNSSIDSNASVPFIFDARGDIGRLAGKVLSVSGRDVPIESHSDGSQCSSSDRGGEALRRLRPTSRLVCPRRYWSSSGTSSGHQTSTPTLLRLQLRLHLQG